MQRQRREPLLPPHHVGDLHQVIVYDVGQVVGGHAIGLEQHLVVEGVGVNHHFAPHQVGEPDLFVLRHPETYHIGLPGSNAGLDLFCG